MTLPTVEKHLQELLKDDYVYKHWQEAFNVIMEAEGDTVQAVEGVEKLACSVLHCTGLTVRIPTHSQSAAPPQLVALKESLSNSILILKSHNWIFGPPPMIDEILDPKEEKEVGESQYMFEGGDAEVAAVVQHELALKQGEIVEVESDAEDEQTPPKLDYPDLIHMCETIEAITSSVLWHSLLRGAEKCMHADYMATPEFQTDLRQHIHDSLQQTQPSTAIFLKAGATQVDIRITAIWVNVGSHIVTFANYIFRLGKIFAGHLDHDSTLLGLSIAITAYQLDMV
ncbi:hypothetical protein EDD16DRAFT_1522324 [Pisolithus croceorrhizus]|nr:hypothetical protein EDD16DRAFT_1522324 [Pisolithus croceorrhizus]